MEPKPTTTPTEPKTLLTDEQNARAEAARLAAEILAPRNILGSTGGRDWVDVTLFANWILNGEAGKIQDDEVEKGWG